MAGVPRLTTHVLDTMHGKPASGMRFDLLMLHGDHSHHVLTSNGDVVPLRWRQFHARFFGLGLSSGERRRQTTPRPTLPKPPRRRRWTRLFGRS